jgi:hypothetical protein
MAAALQATRTHPEVLMVTRLSCFVVMLLTAQTAMAGTIVTWEGEGEIYQSSAMHSLIAFPPPGTPLAVTLSFDPSVMSPTFSPPPGADSCFNTPVTATVTIGSYAYTTGPGALGFTHAQLPGTNCLSDTGGFTQFSLHTVQSPPDTPWPLSGGILILSYRDLIIQDAFPSTPTAPFGASLFYSDPGRFATWWFTGNVSLQAVDQVTPVPEPGTLALVAIGLAATYRKVRARHEN